MASRRDFIKSAAGATAGMLLAGRRGFSDSFAQAPQAGATNHRVVTVAGKRVKVIDIHAHADIPEVAQVLKGTPLEKFASSRLRLGPDRIPLLDKRGIDIQVLDINDFWWYAADRDLATKIVNIHDDGLATWCSAHPDRFLALTSPAVQFPDLAARQLEHAVKNLKMCGAAVGGHVQGEPLSLPKFDPFWAKAQELGVMVFLHPNDAANVVTPDGLKGRGDLVVTVGMPLETTLGLTHLMFDGTLDRFPELKVCAAHGGGYLASYLGRTEIACQIRSNANCLSKKKPSEYLKTQVLVDSMVFSTEGIRHLVAEMGASQIVYGTDGPSLSWPDSVDMILGAQISNAEKEAILGGNLVKLLKL